MPGPEFARLRLFGAGNPRSNSCGRWKANARADTRLNFSEKSSKRCVQARRIPSGLTGRAMPTRLHLRGPARRGFSGPGPREAGWFCPGAQTPSLATTNSPPDGARRNSKGCGFLRSLPGKGSAEGNAAKRRHQQAQDVRSTPRFRRGQS